MRTYIDVTNLTKQISDFKKGASFKHSEYMAGYLSALAATERIIAKLPAADVAPVTHGEWQWLFSMDGVDFYECTVCGEQVSINRCSRKSASDQYPYCHCGAQMYSERSENGK